MQIVAPLLEVPLARLRDQQSDRPAHPGVTGVVVTMPVVHPPAIPLWILVGGLLAPGRHMHHRVDAGNGGPSGHKPDEPASVLDRDGGDHEVCWNGCAREGNGLVLPRKTGEI